MGRGRKIDSTDNPFRERNPRNAEMRRALMQKGSSRLDELNKRLAQRADKQRRFK